MRRREFSQSYRWCGGLAGMSIQRRRSQPLSKHSFEFDTPYSTPAVALLAYQRIARDEQASGCCVIVRE